MDEVKLIGLDFGTTTSSAVIAKARLLHNRVSGRVELSQISECFRSAIAFTPIEEDRLDEKQAACHRRKSGKREAFCGTTAGGRYFPAKC